MGACFVMQGNEPVEQGGFGQQGQVPGIGLAGGQQQAAGFGQQQGGFGYLMHGGGGGQGWSPMNAPHTFGGYNSAQQQQGGGFHGQQGLFPGCAVLGLSTDMFLAVLYSCRLRP